MQEHAPSYGGRSVRLGRSRRTASGVVSVYVVNVGGPLVRSRSPERRYRVTRDVFVTALAPEVSCGVSACQRKIDSHVSRYESLRDEPLSNFRHFRARVFQAIGRVRSSGIDDHWVLSNVRIARRGLQKFISTLLHRMYRIARVNHGFHVQHNARVLSVKKRPPLCDLLDSVMIPKRRPIVEREQRDGARSADRRCSILPQAGHWSR